MWLIATTKPRQEYRARQNLAQQGMRPWLPLCIVQRTIRRHQVTIPEPLFPGYIFIEVDDLAGCSAINNTRGISRLLSDKDGRPSIVSPQVIASVRAMLPNDGPLDMRSPHGHPWRRNQTLRVLSGPFESLSGLCTAISRDRVTILLDLLGRGVQISLPSSAVTAA